MIARETLFQPQSFTDKKMVLGLLEAAALPWDALWICQGTTEFFPPPLSLHRLLSAAQQRAQQMPQSCADKEWRYFKALLQRLCDIVPSITVSSNKQSSYSWAPLWKVFHIPEPVESVRANNNQSPSLRRQQFYTPQPAQKTKMTLSVSQFNAFISCPFKGWAMSLKDAAPDKEMHPIFDARIWGQISHLFVQYYLRNQSDSFSKNTIFSSWPTTLQSYALKKWHESAMLLVTKIPQDLISPSVLIEQSFEYQLGPIQLQGRVDLLSKHGRVVDIKTAQPVLSQWFNEKPTQWQAAIYALATQAQYFGLLYFAADSAHYWESDVALWKSSWQEQLQSYALLWQQGQYYPEPQSTSTCRHCVFKTCCRIDLQESRA
jgi:hypothetical protein